MAARSQAFGIKVDTSSLTTLLGGMSQLDGPALAADFVLDATLAVVDTPWLLEESDPSDAAQVLLEAQLQHADIVVLNKIDALTEADLLRAEERVRGLAPSVTYAGITQPVRLMASDRFSNAASWLVLP